MDEKRLRLIPGIGAEDWERTTASVRQLVVQLGLKIEQLEQRCCGGALAFGSQSEAGSVFVARMLTLVRKGSSSPSLLPQESPSTESMPLAA